MYTPDINSTGVMTKRAGDYIENGYDVFNSKLLKYIPMLPTAHLYQVTKYPYRLDLISDELFGSLEYGEALMLYNNMSVRELSLGRVIRVFNKEAYDKITLNLDGLP